VGEDYPAPDVLGALVSAGVPVVLSSDAHAPGEVGYAFAELALAASVAGVRRTALYRARRPHLVPL
jgi:histidinol-phosphatase (PHP family)